MFKTFELKDITDLFQKYNLEIIKPDSLTLYGKYNGITLFEGTVTRDNKITNIQMDYDLIIYNGEIETCDSAYYPITLETIELNLQKLLKKHKSLTMKLKQIELVKDFTK